jgi:hypothetical protein
MSEETKVTLDDARIRYVELHKNCQHPDCPGIMKERRLTMQDLVEIGEGLGGSVVVNPHTERLHGWVTNLQGGSDYHETTLLPGRYLVIPLGEEP